MASNIWNTSRILMQGFLISAALFALPGHRESNGLVILRHLPPLSKSAVRRDGVKKSRPLFGYGPYYSNRALHRGAEYSINIDKGLMILTK